MSTPDSHLTPTPIVDKNGVLTSRKKNLSATGSNTSPSKRNITLPPVIIQTVSNQEEKKLHHLLYGKFGGTMHLQYLELLKQEDPETITIATRLLSTGSEAAKTRTRRSLDNVLTKMATQHHARGEDWREDSIYGRSPAIKHEMLAAWNIGTVLEESGRMDTAHAGELEEWALASHGKAKRGLENLSDDHWRGIAILSVACTAANSTIPPEYAKHLPEFVEWAGQQENVGAVIDLVERHSTLSVPTLRELMSAYLGTTPSLRDGIL